MTIDLFDYERPGFWDSADDCGCGGDAECPSPECVAEREAVAEEHTADPDEFGPAS